MLDEMILELEYLKTVKSKEVREKINKARMFCDFNEDASYKDFIDEQYRLEEKISKLEKEIADYADKDFMDFRLINHDIKLKWIEDDRIESFKLVEPRLANIDKNEVSIESPLGKQLRTASVGDELTIELPIGKKRVLIVSIKK